MALVTTPGAANANSYASVAEYKAYWASRPNSTTPLAQTDPQIEALMQHACRVLDAAFDWTGVAAVASMQALAWPRTGMLNRNGYAIASTVIPQALKDAQCELAGQMAATDRTADNDAEKQGITKVKAGSVEVSFRDPTVSDDADLQLRDLNAVARMIPDVVKLLLVKSWYSRETVRTAFSFANV